MKGKNRNITTICHIDSDYYIENSYVLTVSCAKQGRQREPENLVLRHSVPIKTLPFTTFR